MNKIVSIPLIVLFFVLISARTSRKPSKKHALKTLNGFCSFVPSGNTVLEGDTVNVQSFYMSKGEVTNFQYQEFLSYLKKHGEDEKYKMAQVDSAQWNKGRIAMNSYEKYYHNHPAYRFFPVVNISKEGAELYCEWLTMVYDSISGGEMNVEFRIPTRAEWIRAARGNNHNYFYTWGNAVLINKEGQQLANYLRIGAEHITRNIETGKMELTKEFVPLDVNVFKDSPDILAPSESYWPNAFGFYNMNGNVAEMISDGSFAVGGSWRSPGYDIRNESIRDFTGPSTEVGFRVIASYVEDVK